MDKKEEPQSAEIEFMSAEFEKFAAEMMPSVKRLLFLAFLQGAIARGELEKNSLLFKPKGNKNV